MSRRAKIWLAVAVLFTLVNLGGAVYAAFGGERLHAGAHVALTLLGAILVWFIAARSRPQVTATVPRNDTRLEQLQQSVDVIALEVERIGEAQRYATRLQSERVETPR
jgi:hypothetical protein